MARGKVGERYELTGEGSGGAPDGTGSSPEPRLLMVASDRISTYDVVHPNPIPDKGKVLTGLSVFWFERTGHIVPNHFVSATDGVPDDVRGRAVGARTLRILPVVCVVSCDISG